jgi:sugar phosphate isomerase/epimerase
MIIGFKTGPKTWEEGKRIVEEDNPHVCELWFDVTKADMYDDMIAWLQNHNVHIGLHHWGVVYGQYKTNLATRDKAIRDTAIQQIKDTIDIGARLECAYVNAHPGAQYVERINLDNFSQELVTENKTEQEESEKLLLEAAQLLQEYAQDRGVLFTIETLPGAEAPIAHQRQSVYVPGNAPLDVMERIGTQGGHIANDITHTAGQVALDATSPDAIWEGIVDFTKRTHTFTNVLHINTVSPPFNGSDSHEGITGQEFAQGNFPSRQQIKQFLSFFKDRDDVFVIPEPRAGTMQENYRALATLVAKV